MTPDDFCTSLLMGCVAKLEIVFNNNTDTVKIISNLFMLTLVIQ
ncbi:hypothetical protein yinte0001_15260 [Yersinia intermedia ATCC 29909]|nr:hypothetical protein yinte0001_15260 [Yersinia intermedia ATCC 29909]